jgi:IclR family transcriptional regulator, acetate operon repressor
MSSIERAMRILDIIAGEPDGVRVTDVATTLGLNRAIPHRLLAELIELGYVAQDPTTERYRATFKLGSLGLRQLETAGILRWAKDDLSALAAESRELVRLAVGTGSSLRFVAKAQGSNSALMIDSASGSNVVLHATASGKAWLSTLPDDQVRAVLTERGLAAETPHTETDLRRILEEVGRAREAGYAVTHEEMEVGINAIAAPLVPPELPSGPAVGTVSIAGPAARLNAQVLLGFAPALRATAKNLSEQWHVYEYLTALTSPNGGS